MDNVVWAFGMWLTAVIVGSAAGLVLQEFVRNARR
jgi:hypothetical protein